MDFPEVLEKTSKPTIEFKGRTYESTNTLFGRYEGIDGFKTGTNNAGGANFSGTAERGDIRIIVVVMGSTHGSRFRDTTALLDYGFAIMQERRIEARKVSPSKSTVIINGKVKQLDGYSIDEDVFVSIRDFAFLLRNTPIEFDVEINNSAIHINTEAEYTIVGEEMPDVSNERVLPVLSDKRITIDGDEKEFPVYEIHDRYVVSLSDITETNMFDAVWADEVNTTFINYVEEEEPLQAAEPVQSIPIEIETQPVEVEHRIVDINPDNEQKITEQHLLLFSGICALGILIIIPLIYFSKKKQKKKRQRH